MHKNNGPLFHIVKRVDVPWYFSWCVRAVAIVLALVCCGVISTIVTKDNPVQIFATIIDGSFGSSRKFMVLLQNTAMLLCVALALTPAFKMRFWNIGGEGQALIGALAAAACMILMKNQSNLVVIIAMIITSICAGALWGAIPAFFKAKFGTNETLFTLMMNYVAIQLVAYFSVVWENPKGSGSIGVINANSKIEKGIFFVAKFLANNSFHLFDVFHNLCLDIIVDFSAVFIILCTSFSRNCEALGNGKTDFCHFSEVCTFTTEKFAH